MGADLIMTRPEGRQVLVPATPHDMQEFCERVGQCKDVRAKLTQPRSLPQQRFYWGLLQKVVDNHPFYATSEALHIWLKLKMGLVDHIELHDGTVHIRASSTSFENMDGITFKQYLDKAIDLIVIEVLPGVRRTELLKEVSTMLGMSYRQITSHAA